MKLRALAALAASAGLAMGVAAPSVAVTHAAPVAKRHRHCVAYKTFHKHRHTYRRCVKYR